MSHVQEIKTIQQVTRWQVIKLLDWTDLQYGTFQMERAYAYIDHAIGLDEWGVQQISQTTSFWAWWRNHWHKRDMAFVPDAKKMSLDERRLFYEITHDAEAIEFTPHRVIMDDSFAKVIYKLTHEAKGVKI